MTQPTTSPTKILSVLHLKDFGSNFMGDVPASLEGYIDVAVLADVDLDDAYRLTNSIHSAWFTAPQGAGQSLLWVRGPARSTSVGDVILVVEAGKTTGYVVAMMGFTEFDANHMVVGAPNREN